MLSSVHLGPSLSVSIETSLGSRLSICEDVGESNGLGHLRVVSTSKLLGLLSFELKSRVLDNGIGD